MRHALQNCSLPVMYRPVLQIQDFFGQKATIASLWGKRSSLRACRGAAGLRQLLAYPEFAICSPPTC